MAVNSPRPCIICGHEFYPSISKSLFHCENINCKEAYETGMDEMNCLLNDDQRKINELNQEEEEE